MRENKKYKEVKVQCFKDSKFCHYAEAYQNITNNELEEKLNVLVQAGWDRFDIDTDGKKRTLVLKKSRQPSQQRPVSTGQKTPVDSTGTGRKTPKFTGSEGNSGRLRKDSKLISTELAKAKDWKELAIEDREKKNKKK